MEIEHVKFSEQSSSTMRSITSKDADLVSHFDKFNDGDINTSIKNTYLKEMLIDNLTVVTNKDKNESQFPLEHLFGFCKTVKKITKSLGFNLTLKSIDP